MNRKLAFELALFGTVLLCMRSDVLATTVLITNGNGDLFDETNYTSVPAGFSDFYIDAYDRWDGDTTNATDGWNQSATPTSDDGLAITIQTGHQITGSGKLMTTKRGGTNGDSIAIDTGASLRLLQTIPEPEASITGGATGSYDETYRVPTTLNGTALLEAKVIWGLYITANDSSEIVLDNASSNNILQWARVDLVSTSAKIHLPARTPAQLLSDDNGIFLDEVLAFGSPAVDGVNVNVVSDGSSGAYIQALQAGLDGDFDGDGDVDGTDFLHWQRDSGDQESLSLWQSNYGDPSAAHVATVPEPTGAALILGLGVVAFASPHSARRRSLGVARCSLKRVDGRNRGKLDVAV